MFDIFLCCWLYAFKFRTRMERFRSVKSFYRSNNFCLFWIPNECWLKFARIILSLGFSLLGFNILIYIDTHTFLIAYKKERKKETTKGKGPLSPIHACTHILICRSPKKKKKKETLMLLELFWFSVVFNISCFLLSTWLWKLELHYILLMLNSTILG